VGKWFAWFAWFSLLGLVLGLLCLVCKAQNRIGCCLVCFAWFSWFAFLGLGWFATRADSFRKSHVEQQEQTGRQAAII